jgi:4-hydroxybenzoate polyprenyltransferase
LNWSNVRLSPVAFVFRDSVVVRQTIYRFRPFASGVALAISPSAAWIAVRGDLTEVPILTFAFSCLMWTAGFDVLYACQDLDFDRRFGLRSIPARFGIKQRLDRTSSFSRFVVLIVLYLMTGLGWVASRRCDSRRGH